MCTQPGFMHSITDIISQDQREEAKFKYLKLAKGFLLF